MPNRVLASRLRAARQALCRSRFELNESWDRLYAAYSTKGARRDRAFGRASERLEDAVYAINRAEGEMALLEMMHAKKPVH